MTKDWTFGSPERQLLATLRAIVANAEPYRDCFSPEGVRLLEAAQALIAEMEAWEAGGPSPTP